MASEPAGGWPYSSTLEGKTQKMKPKKKVEQHVDDAKEKNAVEELLEVEEKETVKMREEEEVEEENVFESAVASSVVLPLVRRDRCAACRNPLDGSLGYVCPGCNEAAFCPPPSACFRKRFAPGPTNNSSLFTYRVPQWHSDECR